MSALQTPVMAGGVSALSLVDVLRERARRQPERRAYTFLPAGEEEGDRLTWAELDRGARAVAACLQARALAGERILLLYRPGLDFVAAFFGCLYAGAVAVPAYPPRSERHLARLLAIAADAKPRAALVDTRTAAAVPRWLRAAPTLGRLAWIETGSLAAGAEAGWQEPEVGSAGLAFLQYTSGSTAAPKGVRVSHGNLVHNQRVIQGAFEQSASSVVVGWLPLYHDMGLIGNVLQPLWAGAACVLMPPVAFLQRPRRWLEAIDRYRATTSGGPNFAYDLCLQKIAPAGRNGLDLSSWRVAYNGAEPVRAETQERFAAAFASCGFRREAFYPCYGLAEATLFVAGGVPAAPATVREVDAAALAGNRVEAPRPGAAVRPLVGCGRPGLGQTVAIVDPEARHLRAAGEIGEIWVAGESVADGYWNRPEESAAVFGARLEGSGSVSYLRTGDLGFELEGELFVTGRLKDLIILRGRNHYPQDLERTAEQSHPALRPGCGVAFSVEVDGEERLILAHEVERTWRGSLDEVIEAVRRTVAEEHEARVQEVVLLRVGGVPRTSSGKVRRQACRAAWLAGALDALNAPDVSDTPGAPDPVPAPIAVPGDDLPTLDREALLALPAAARQAALTPWLCARVGHAVRLTPGAVPLDRPLTGLGFDSLAAVELQHALAGELSVTVDFALFLDGATLLEIAAEILRALAAEPEPAEEELVAQPDAGAEHPLSWGQRSLLFVERRAASGGTGSLYTLAGAARVRGRLSPVALGQALSALSARHPALRTTFGERDGEPVQRTHGSLPPELGTIDLRELDEAAGASRIAAEAARPFDLERGSLLRVTLCALADGWVLVLAVHHLVADLWSLTLLVGELAALYREETGGESARLRPLPVTYADYVHWQRRRLSGPAGLRLWNFWRERLAGPLPVLALPTDRQRPALQSFRGATSTLRLDAETPAAHAFARARGATLFTVLVAAFEVLLHRYSGQEDLLLGTPVASRANPQTAGLVGYFVNPVVLRADLTGSPSFAEVLDRARRDAVTAFNHQDFPFALLAERLQPRRDPSRPPLVQAFFVLQKAELIGAPDLGAFALGHEGGRLVFADLTLESLPLPAQGSQVDLTLLLAQTGAGLAATLEHNLDLFDPVTASRLLAHFRELLAGALTRPELPVGDLPLLTAAERIELHLEGRGDRPLRSAAPSPVAGLSLDRAFAAQAARTPEATAVVLGREELTYGELDRRANRLAHHLRRRGASLETPVCLCLERSIDLVVAILGVLKAGGAYVPLDPATPPERLDLLLADVGGGAAAPLLVTRADTLVATGPGAEVRRIDLDRDWERIAAEDGDARPPAVAGGGSVAYVIYTSGSTGLPKGVEVSHANAVRLFAATDALCGLRERGASDVWTLFHSYTFDFSVWEIWGALLHGGRLVVVPRDVARSPERFRELLVREGVTVLSQTPSAFRQLARHEESAAGLPELALRLVVFGGEALEPANLRPWAGRHGVEAPRLINLYGITETTVHVTFRPLAAADVSTGGSSPIGRPLQDLRVHLLDRRMQPVPPGVPGEIFVGGAGLARGYLRRPEQTAARFVPDPFCAVHGELGARLYRSGDLARRREDGDLEYLGRIDHQVKIRGFRVELGEIEAALASHPEVREGVVLARQDLPGEGRLVAYVVLRGGSAVRSGELRDHLGRRLPEYMVPARFVILPELPLTRNGKVDRAALPAPDGERPDLEEAFTSPRTPVERTLASIWSEVLGVRAVGVHDDFFALGGHSLLHARLLSRVRQAFGVELPLAQAFARPTIAGMADLLSETGVATAPASIPRAPRDWPLPLSFGQERLWFLDRLEERSLAAPAYNVPAAVRLTGDLDRPALSAALSTIVGRHEVLRTSFPAPEGHPVQRIAAAAALPLPLVDLAALPEPEREAHRLAGAESRVAFDLAAGPLLRATLLRLAGREHLLLLSLHHAVADGWSLGVLLRELAHGYGSAGSEPLPPLPLQYADYAVWQRQRLAAGELAGELGFWRDRLAGAPPRVELATDRPRPAVQTFRGRRRGERLPAGHLVDLEALARACGATLFMVLFAAFAALLRRVSGQEDLVIGSPIANRNRRELEELIGFFVNLLPLRADLAGDPRFGELVERLRAGVLAAYQHQELPFESLVAELRPERNLAETPLFQILLVLQNHPMPELRLDGLELSPLAIDNGTAKFDLTLEAAVEGAGLLVSLEHSTDLFDAARSERLLGQFRNLLTAAVADPERRLSELALLSEVERHQLLNEWQDTASAFPRETCLHHRFEAWVARAPEATAVISGAESLTYRELDARAGALARRLRTRGVGPEVVVGLCAERSAAMVVGVVAILKAGGAYLPLDPSQPRERREWMMADAGAPVLLTGGGVGEELSAYAAHHLRIEDRADRSEDASGAVPVRELAASLAYVLYTSGSTGRPKGVQIPHRAAVNLLATMQERVHMASGEGLLSLTTLAFDISVLELFLPLTTGGWVEPVSREVAMDGERLAAALARSGARVLQATPAGWRVLLDSGWAGDLRLRALCCGEALERDLAERLIARCGRVWNAYGPTETTVFSTVREVAAGELPSIGRPIGNTRVHLLDRFEQGMALVPSGSLGELGIGGDGLARGYRGRPDLTAERFVPDPWSGEPGARLYRTGDLGRRLPGGEIDFRGRIDHQIKVRGFRIEPGEIEAVLGEHPGIERAVVVARRDRRGEAHLAAYFVAQGVAAPGVEELRGFLAARLPSYMVPASLLRLPSLPLTANGKFDRRALPAPEAVEGAEAAVFAPPSTAVEIELARIWGEVLGRARIGVHDNFFALGGHSLLIAQLGSRYRGAFGVELSLRELFAAPTIAELGRRIEAGRERTAPVSPPPLKPAARERRRVSLRSS